MSSFPETETVYQLVHSFILTMGGVFHDARVHDLVILSGKYYLADAGYPICDALLVPFHGVWYHPWEWESNGLQLSGFKPGSTLLDPGLGQPTPLGPLGWSIMSLDGLVQPRKIVQVYLMCPHSH